MKNFFITLIALLLTINFVSYSQENKTGKIVPRLKENVDSEIMNQWADSVFDKLTLDEKIGQLFMPIVETKNTAQNKAQIKKFIEDYKIGGILFSKGTSVDQAILTNYAREISSVPFFISLDGEWGLAMRLTDTPRFPKNMMLGAIDNDSLIEAYGREVGRQCNLMGININFAPVLDINSNPKNPVINTRSFGEEKDMVSAKASAYAKGLESRNVIAVGKHFPGHGDTSEDSHHTLPLITHDSARMYDYEISPFRDFVNNKYSGMLTAHLSVPSLDKTKEASSLSKPIVTGILKDELGFDGLIFTDGLAMKGVSGDPNHCVKSILAGNDVLLGPVNVPLQFKRVKEAVANGTIPLSLIEEKCLKILKYKYITGLNDSYSIDVNNINKQLNSEHSKSLNQMLHKEAITLLKDEDHIIPIGRLDEKKIMAISVGSVDKNAFNKTLSKYTNITQYNLETGVTKDDQMKAVNIAKNSDLIIVGISSAKTVDREFINSLCRGKKVILVFFTSPYRLSSYKELISRADGVVLAYENSELAGDYAAQLLFGGIPAKGKLSVSIPGLFKRGTGETTEKNRLGYVHPEQMGMDIETLLKIDTIVEKGLSDKAFPGCEVIIVKNGNVVYEKYYGYFDYAKSKKVEWDDIYDLASVTKGAATVPAMMKVRDDHKIHTAQKISQYVPELKNTDKATLTFREALMHETGLQAGFPFYRMAINPESLNEKPLFKAVRDADYRLQADERLFAKSDYRYYDHLISSNKKAGYTLPIASNLYLHNSFRDSILLKIASLPLKNKGRYRYSCLNFVLLRQAIENITGTGMDKYLTEKIYKPIGANSLMFNPVGKYDKSKIAPTENDYFLRKQMLVGYVHDELAAFSGGVEGNAGLFGNGNDLAKLMQVLLNEGEYGGDRLFTKETARLFTLSKSPKSRRGLGFDKPDTKNPLSSPTAKQVSASTFGHTGFTGPAFWVDPDNQLIYIFLTNRVYPNRWNKKLTKDSYRTKIQEVIYDSFNYSK